MSIFFKTVLCVHAHPKIIFKINIILNLNNGMIFHFASANRTRKGIPLQFLYKQAEKVESQTPPAIGRGENSIVKSGWFGSNFKRAVRFDSVQNVFVALHESRRKKKEEKTAAEGRKNLETLSYTTWFLCPAFFHQNRSAIGCCSWYTACYWLLQLVHDALQLAHSQSERHFLLEDTRWFVLFVNASNLTIAHPIAA